MRSERFEMRLEPDVANAIDTWRDRNMPGSSRAHAIRALIGHGLRIGADRFSDGEKTVISLLGSLFHHFDFPSKEIDALIKAFRSGNQWVADDLMGALYSAPLASIDDAKFVSRVLEMWCFIEESLDRLTPEEKAEVLKPSEGEQAILDEGEIPTSPRPVSFEGFSEAEEPNLVCAANFLVEDLGHFPWLKGRSLASPHKSKYKDEVARLRFYDQLKAELCGAQVSVSNLRDFFLAQGAMPWQEYLARQRKKAKHRSAGNP